jgi:peptidoglycan/xylan/chitin deacetylase (PgdA/CDA1 family)/CelD/BcsL family acetyltransferase involved in cellulose biosynthesis
MRVIEIREEPAFTALHPAWTTLLRASASNTIFLSPEWSGNWWSAYGTPGDLRVLAAYDDAGICRGIAPLRVKRVQRYGQAVQALQFIGDAPENSDSDYMDFIIAPGFEQPVIEAFGRHWDQDLRRGTVLQLNEIPSSSPNLAPLKASAESSGLIAIESDNPCAAVSLPQSWDAYLGMLKPRFRTKIRSVLRTLENRPEVRFRFCERTEELHRLLPILFDLHTRRWRQEHKPGVFGDARKRSFYRALSPVLLDRGWLRFSYLEWKGQVLACQFGFVYENVYSQLQEGYEPAAEHWNLGAGLRAWSLRELLQQGCRQYDFLGGTGRHKSDWGAETKLSKRLLVAYRSARNALFLHGPEWDAGVRKTIRAMIPANILAARQANGVEQPDTDPSWIRQAAAQFYVHSGTPALMRSLRRRYQLSMEPNGVLPKISWQRRAEGAARIFYYHRVNNDRDPFFPAISTDLFEAQMEHLARNYKVVGMAELCRHLEAGDSPEPVVGITFDDGYRDNFDHAFPILKRYHLPATIFLTTGNIDSGEPPWFERLAEALKKTNVEFLDLEIDVPRRFRTRTEAERLESNTNIFQQLRVLSDADRRMWLGEILRQLGTPPEESERRGKMLTWDQARLMTTHDIAFGGHTVTHPFLSKLTSEQAVWEVTECKRRIEDELQAPTHFFAYPNGREEDFAAANKDLLRDAGYRAAVTTVWGLNYRSTDRMELKRGGPWEENPALFALKLDWYQLASQ